MKVHEEFTVSGKFLGTFLTGPWMKKFYVSADDQTINHVEGIGVVKEVVNRINAQIDEPSRFVKRGTDSFWG